MRVCFRKAAYKTFLSYGYKRFRFKHVGSNLYEIFGGYEMGETQLFFVDSVRFSLTPFIFSYHFVYSHVPKHASP